MTNSSWKKKVINPNKNSKKLNIKKKINLKKKKKKKKE
jgi:hypothetical protein